MTTAYIQLLSRQWWPTISRPAKVGLVVTLVVLTACVVYFVGGLGKAPMFTPNGSTPGSYAVIPSTDKAAQVATTPATGTLTTAVNVAGEATILAQPDIARISVGVQVRDKSVAGAQTQAADNLNKIIAAAKGKGVADADIETTNYSIQTNYIYNRDSTPTFDGYILNSSVQITVRGIDKDKKLAGGVIDAATGAGANIVNGISFDVSDTTTLRNQAIAAAISDARAKADQMAVAGKFSIIGITTVTETSAPRSSPVMPVGAAPAAGDSSSTPVQSGAFRYSYTVQVSFSIK